MLDYVRVINFRIIIIIIIIMIMIYYIVQQNSVCKLQDDCVHFV